MTRLEEAESSGGRLEPFCFALKQALRNHIQVLESIGESKRREDRDHGKAKSIHIEHHHGDSPSYDQHEGPTLYTHNLWLNYLKPVSLGLVFSTNALPPPRSSCRSSPPDAQRALEALTIPRPVTTDHENNDHDHENPPRTLRNTRQFLTEFLGWKPELLDFFRPNARAQMFAGQRLVDESPEPPDELRHDLVQYDDTLEPGFAYRWPQAPETGSRWCLLGLDVPPDVDLDRKPHEADEAAWVESPRRSSSDCCTRPASRSV